MMSCAGCLQAHAKAPSWEPAGQGVLAFIPCWPCGSEWVGLWHVECAVAPQHLRIPQLWSPLWEQLEPPTAVSLVSAKPDSSQVWKEGECWNRCRKFARQWWLQFSQEQVRKGILQLLSSGWCTEVASSLSAGYRNSRHLN